MVKENKKEFILKVICHIIFVLYFLFLIKIILFKYIDSIGALNKIITGDLDGFRSINLIPLKSIVEFTKILFNGSFSRGFNNIVGNILVFAPLGYFLPLLFKKCKSLKAVILTGVLLSCLFEICQYFFYLGSADIDDVILNSLGTIIGYAFFNIIDKLTQEKRTKIYILTIILSIIGFFIAGYTAIDYFGVMFGINGGYDDNNSSVKLEDSEILDDGTSIAITNKENMNLETIYLLSKTKFSQKNIYDMNGDKVEIKPATKDELQVDAHINIKGYEEEDKFYATEIIINNYLF